MSTKHAEHNHTHGMAKQTLRLAFFLSLIIVAAEFGGGLLAHSLALLSDAMRQQDFLQPPHSILNGEESMHF